MENKLETFEMPETTLESVLERQVGLNSIEVAALRAQLAGTKALLGADGLLRFKPYALVRSVTAEKRRARRMLSTDTAKAVFDDLCSERLRSGGI